MNSTGSNLFSLVQSRRWNEARERIERFPRSVFCERSHDNGQTGLHELCRRIKFIHRSNDDEFSDEDEPDHHTEIDKQHNEAMYSLAKCMLQMSKSVGESDRRYQVNEYRDGVPSVAYRVCRSLLETSDINGNTPLHILCSNSGDTSMMNLFLQWCNAEYFSGGPKMAQLVVAKNSLGCTPLHFIAESGFFPFSSLKMMAYSLWKYTQPMVQEYQEETPLVQDNDGDTPLHWALCSATSPRRLHWLLMWGGDAALKMVNNEGDFPMTQYSREHCEEWEQHEDDEEVEQVWERVQGVLSVVLRHERGTPWSPLHEIAASLLFLPRGILAMALRFCEKDLRRYNSDGKAPLHVALSTPPDKEIDLRHFREALRLFVEDPRVPHDLATSDGRLPVHLAVESSQEHWVIQSLLERNPNILASIDPVTQLPLFLLAAVETNQTLTVVYDLLRKDPSVIRTLLNHE